jgi:hypothetical protein
MSGLPAGTPGPDILAVLGGVIERGEGLEAFAVAVRAGPRLVRPADRDGPAGQGVFERRAGACATVATIGLGAARLPGLPAVLRGGEGQPISDASFERARAACSGA